MVGNVDDVIAAETPLLRGPTFTTGQPKIGVSLMPAEELPIKAPRPTRPMAFTRRENGAGPGYLRRLDSVAPLLQRGNVDDPPPPHRCWDR